MNKPLTQRQLILAFLESSPGSTLPEIIEATGLGHSQAKNAVGDMRKIDLLLSRIDDVTVRVCYRINTKHDKAKPVVAKNTGSQASGNPVGESLHLPPEGLAVVEQPKLDDTPAKACSDEKDAEIRELRSLIDLITEDHDRSASLVKTLTSQRNAWREMAEMYGHETPVDLAAMIGEHQLSLDAWATAAKEFGIKNPIELSAAISARDQRIASLEGNLSLPMEDKDQGGKYMVSVSGGSAPSVIHDDELSARAEAERLSEQQKNRHATIYVLQVVATLEPRSSHEWV